MRYYREETNVDSGLLYKGGVAKLVHNFNNSESPNDYILIVQDCLRGAVMLSGDYGQFLDSPRMNKAMDTIEKLMKSARKKLGSALDAGYGDSLDLESEYGQVRHRFDRIIIRALSSDNESDFLHAIRDCLDGVEYFAKGFDEKFPGTPGRMSPQMARAWVSAAKANKILNRELMADQSRWSRFKSYIRP